MVAWAMVAWAMVAVHSVSSRSAGLARWMMRSVTQGVEAIARSVGDDARDLAVDLQRSTDRAPRGGGGDRGERLRVADHSQGA